VGFFASFIGMRVDYDGNLGAFSNYWWLNKVARCKMEVGYDW